MANADAINKVIASIRGEIEATKDVGFNMSDYESTSEPDKSGRHCGTVACIAGHAALVAGADMSNVDPHEEGRKFLEISESQADDLFIFGPYQANLTLATVEMHTAIRTLEHLRDTGEVDWTV